MRLSRSFLSIVVGSSILLASPVAVWAQEEPPSPSPTPTPAATNSHPTEPSESPGEAPNTTESPSGTPSPSATTAPSHNNQDSDDSSESVASGGNQETASSTDTLSLGDAITQFAPRNGESIYVEGAIDGLPQAGLIAVNQNQQNQELIAYSGRLGGLLYGIVRLGPQVHSSGSSVTSVDPVCDPVNDLLRNTLCSSLTEDLAQLIGDVCPNLECADDVAYDVQRAVSQVIYTVCPGGILACEQMIEDLVFDVLGDVCPNLECPDIAIRFIREQIAELCGGTATDCADLIVAIGQEIIQQVCPDLECPDTLMRLILEQIAELCGETTTDCSDLVVSLAQEVAEKLCPNLACGQEVIDELQNLITETCGTNGEGCLELLFQTVNELIEQTCPNLECTADLIQSLTSLINDLFSSICPNGIPCVPLDPTQLCELIGCGLHPILDECAGAETFPCGPSPQSCYERGCIVTAGGPVGSNIPSIAAAESLDEIIKVGAESPTVSCGGAANADFYGTANGPVISGSWLINHHQACSTEIEVIFSKLTLTHLSLFEEGTSIQASCTSTDSRPGPCNYVQGADTYYCYVCNGTWQVTLDSILQLKEKGQGGWISWPESCSRNSRKVLQCRDVSYFPVS